MPAILRVRVIPRARRNEIAGWREGALVLHVTAAPVEGAANKLLLRFLSGQLGLRPADIAIVSGQNAHDTVLCIEALSQDALGDLLSSV